MPVPPPSVPIENPGPLLTRELAADAKKLFVEVGKAGFNLATGGYTKLIGNAKAIYDELAKLSDGQLGWVLMHRSMSQAVAELYSELNLEYPALFEDAVADSLSATVVEQLTEANVVIDASFFRQPAPQFVAQIAESVQQRLESIGLTSVEAGAMANRLPSYFLHSLQREFGAERTKYQKLVDQSATPFDDDAERRCQWLEYSTWLDRRLHEPLFEERFCLLDVFVDLRAWAVPEQADDDARLSRGSRSVPNEQVTDSDEDDSEQLKPAAFLLEDRLAHWLEELKSEYRIDNAVRVITGGPGSGKSSSVRRFAAHMAQQEVGLNAVYVPLHLFDYQGRVEEALDHFCTQHQPRLPDGLLAPPAHADMDTDQPHRERLLLIFDGLDELAKSGNVGAEAASDFVVAIQKLIEICGNSRQLAVLFCGRPIAVSQSTQRTIADRHVFHLLPYVASAEDKKRLRDPLTLLDHDQRDEWWQRYGKSKGTDEAGLPDELKNKGDDFDEITAEPLLNYLIALTYGRAQSGTSDLDLSGDINLNEVYQDMLKGVWERRYADADRIHPEQDGRRIHPAVKPLKQKEFEHLLEDIALAAWHSAGRAASMDQVLAHLDDQQKSLIDTLSDDARSGVLKLFLGFYIQSRRMGPGQELFEFTHKSFGEYLTARRLQAAVQTIYQGWKYGQDNPRGPGYSMDQTLVEWARTFGPTAIDEDLLRFLHREFRGPAVASTDLEEWRQFLGTLMTVVLNSGLPMEQVPGVKGFPEMNRHAIHSEQALLILHDCCAAALNEASDATISPTDIAWPQPTSLGTWLRRVVEQPSGYATTPVLKSLAHLRLVPLEDDSEHTEPPPPKQSLVHAWLCRANLRVADLKRAKLEGAYLRRADLYAADLRGADLYAADLRGADLRGAKLRGAKLRGANLTMANLTGADFRGAHLGDANLTGADFRGAHLGDAKLEEANLTGAQLGGAYLEGATVDDAQLEVAVGTPAVMPDGTKREVEE